MSKGREDLWIEFDLDGYPFQMSVGYDSDDNILVEIRHMWSSLSGSGPTYVDALEDVISMAKEVGPVYLDLEPSEFYSGAAALFKFQQMLDHFIAYKVASLTERKT